MIRFRRGMTIHNRRKLREEILQQEVYRAHQRAEVAHLSAPCRQAMAVTHQDAAQARELHASCTAEEHGGTGCLCLCHDVVSGGIVTGTARLT